MADSVSRGNILGWQGLVAVDGVTYNWMGGAPGPAPVNQLSLEYTSTRSIFTFDVAGKVLMTVTFLSPVYPDDMARQSQQFSYISAKAKSSDGAPHHVQVYMDVSGGILPCFLSLRFVHMLTRYTQNGPAATTARLSSGMRVPLVISFTTSSSAEARRNSERRARLPAGAIGIWRPGRTAA